MLKADKNGTIVISALKARANFWQTLKDYVKLAAPEPEILAIIGQESKHHGTDRMTSQRIDRIIKAARAQRKR